jgi:hypothetical protein
VGCSELPAWSCGMGAENWGQVLGEQGPRCHSVSVWHLEVERKPGASLGITGQCGYEEAEEDAVRVCPHRGISGLEQVIGEKKSKPSSTRSS